MASFTARMDFSRPTSKCRSIDGNITMPRMETAGKITVFPGLFSVPILTRSFTDNLLFRIFSIKIHFSLYVDSPQYAIENL